MEIEGKTIKKRLLSLDVLRGFTIAGMILVNNGAGPNTFMPLEHAEWNGLSLADLVFPFFLFMVGISTYISLRKFDFKASKGVIYKILKRTIVILLIGWGIYWFEGICDANYFPFDNIRIPGVLHRIAISYGIVALLSLFVNHKRMLWITIILLVAYTFILLLGNGYACDETNVLSIVDRHLFGEAHLYHKSPIDPEGFLGLIPSVAHVLIGFLCGKVLMTKHDMEQKIMYLFLIGFILMSLGLLLSYGLPFNKRIWSPTFVLFTCGMASSLLAFLTYIIDLKGKKGWTPFFVCFGVNPLFIYVMSELLAIVFGAFYIKPIVYDYISIFLPFPYFASLAYAIGFVLLNWIIGYPLYKKKIYIKI